MRALLDARSEAQAVHGLEMRTELRFGDVSNELARQLGESPGQMLILGIHGYSELAGRLGSLFAESRWPVLIVHREHDRAAA
jgi:hypothetical protein